MSSTLYSKADLARDLRARLDQGWSAAQIAAWAYDVFSNRRSSLASDVRPYLMDLFFMEEGPEFELTAAELREFASRLSPE